ncbi:MAG: fibrinogen-related protein [Myxococcota bacterium]
METIATVVFVRLDAQAVPPRGQAHALVVAAGLQGLTIDLHGRGRRRSARADDGERQQARLEPAAHRIDDPEQPSSDGEHPQPPTKASAGVGPERLEQGVHAGMSLGGISMQPAEHRAVDEPRDPGSRRWRVERGIVEYRVGQLRHVVPLKGALLIERLVQGHTKRELIGPGVTASAGEELGSHIARRAHQGASLGHAGAQGGLVPPGGLGRGLGGLPPVDVACDMTTDGGGWTLIAFNDQTTTFVEFDRSWQEYKDGFGALASGDMGWLGNDRIHALSSGGVDLQVRHNHPWTNAYANFSVGDEASLYQLAVSTTPDSLDGGWFASFHDGLPFSTFDNENDTHATINCAEDFRAGWWYADCRAVSVASAGSPAPADSQVYWRPQAGGGVLLLDWVAMWIR